MGKIETRTIAVTELRAGPAFEVAGRAASYNKLSSDLGGFVERLAPRCFARSLRNGDDVICTINHDTNQVLGRTKNNTLTLRDSDEGLDFVCKLNPKSQAHRDLHAAVERGDLDSCSFAFGVDEGGDSFDSIVDPYNAGRSIARRTIRSAKLFDTSIVTHPAYPGIATFVSARQLRSCHYSAASPASGYMPTVVTHPHLFRARAAADVEKRKQRHAEARRKCAEFPELSFETVLRGIKLGYSEDLMLELRWAAIGERIKTGRA
jgi:HK97 family phage prohead protease